MSGWTLAPSLVRLREEINEAYAHRSRVSDGSIGDVSHSSRTSDHNPDPAGWVRAIDVTQWDPGTPGNIHDDVAEAVAEYLRARKDPRIKYVIWKGRMFSSYATRTCKAWEWRPYTGPNGHFHHVHISVVADVRGLDGSAWGFYKPKPPAPAVRRRYMGFKLSDPFVTDESIAKTFKNGYYGDLVEVSELQLRLTRASEQFDDPDLDPGDHDGEYGPKSADAWIAFQRKIVVMQTMTKQTRWAGITSAVSEDRVNVLRWWNGQG